MKKGYGVGDRYSQDPIGSDAPRGKDRSERRHRNDPGFTPTEQHVKDGLMRQFLKRDGTQGSSEAYCASPVWCRCGRRMKLEGKDKCEPCLWREYAAEAPKDSMGLVSMNNWFKKWFVEKIE